MLNIPHCDVKKNALPLAELIKGPIGSDISISIETYVGVCQSEVRGENEDKGRRGHLNKRNPVGRGSEVIDDTDLF